MYILRSISEIFHVFCNLNNYLQMVKYFLTDLDLTFLFENYLEPDVHHMKSQILSILINVIQDRAVVPFFRSFFKSLNPNNSGTINHIKKRLMAIFLTFKGLSARRITIFISFAL